ncbi:hypothetical protein IEQ34_020210 [Dendrobium chrysotoxum]|uniref:Sieve element occlusion C-terminal domain-containing protein n=1 Tax=Dendrobium chrysotoxum TaxID=161865 RepID=A0AAV7G1A9_DENCH|nr:hypothetical protein IEQ34_020210 [Dendrobium chrysotoxum]
MHLFEEVHVDNQRVLRTLFALKDEFPLLDAFSNQKVGVSILQNKEIILFISKPEVKFDRFLLIMQQLQSYSRNGQEKPYEIVWVPIVTTATWSNIDERAFSHLAEIMIFYSINQPTKLSLSVINFIHEVWHYRGDPMMVVLDSTGKVIASDAFDMISVWGEKAYPFSVSRERELWEAENWTIEVLLNGIHPLLSYWIEDGRTICLYGSNNLEWVRQLAYKMKEVQKSGILLELLYVAANNVDHRENILTAIAEEKLSRYLSHIDISIFWLRLESIKKLKTRLGSGTESGFIMREINSLLSFDTDKGGWLLISEGSSTEPLKLTGNKALQCLSLFQVWGQKVNKLGFLGAIRKFLDPPSLIDQCNYCTVTPFIDDMNNKIVSCPNCLSTMEKYYVYQCMTS